jgi:cold shock CspA family protein
MQAKIITLFPEKDYGFLETPDGREVYFHRDSVLVVCP